MSTTEIKKPPARVTKKRADKRKPASGLGPVESLRFLWTQLTSMRTALVLLFALALAAIPGSLVPQRQVSPIGVDDFIAANPTLGPIYDKIGMFNVYTSPWFSAIYLLLFLSLVGCIIPRVGVYAKAVRAQPPKTPRHLSRLPAYASAPFPEPVRPFPEPVEGAEGPDQDQLLDRAAAELKRQRYRVARQPDGSISAERGYLREAGNLVFHVSLLFVLLGVAIGGLTGYRGTSVIVVGQGFSNVLTQYNDFTAGPSFGDGGLVPFSLTVKSFDAKFETGPVQRGAARVFSAEIEVTDRPGATPRLETLEVNEPLKIGSTSVHLVGHGYAPKVTVRDGDGNIAYAGPVIFLPQDGNFSSAGVIKVPDARPERLAFQGFYLPTAQVLEGKGPVSVFPDWLQPAMYLTAWYGPPKAETGTPENVYSLNTDGMTQFKSPDGKDLLRILLDEPGKTYELPDGKGSITYEGAERWVKLQVGDTPGVMVALIAIGAAVAGLCLSLFIRPRRVWIRLKASGPGHTTESSSTVIEVAGLDRADARTGLTDDVDELAKALARPTEADPTEVGK